MVTSLSHGVDLRFGPPTKLGALQREIKVDPWIAPVFVKRSTDQPFVQQAPGSGLDSVMDRGPNCSRPNSALVTRMTS